MFGFPGAEIGNDGVPLPRFLHGKFAGAPCLVQLPAMFLVSVLSGPAGRI
jgi:hypothetical protein